MLLFHARWQGCCLLQILLVTEQGDVLEGTQTNFFAVVDGAVYTAREGVLLGTVRGVLLEVGVVLRPCADTLCMS